MKIHSSKIIRKAMALSLLSAFILTPNLSSTELYAAEVDTNIPDDSGAQNLLVSPENVNAGNEEAPGVAIDATELTIDGTTTADTTDIANSPEEVVEEDAGVPSDATQYEPGIKTSMAKMGVGMAAGAVGTAANTIIPGSGAIVGVIGKKVGDKAVDVASRGLRSLGVDNIVKNALDSAKRTLFGKGKSEKTGKSSSGIKGKISGLFGKGKSQKPTN